MADEHLKNIAKGLVEAFKSDRKKPAKSDEAAVSSFSDKAKRALLEAYELGKGNLS